MIYSYLHPLSLHDALPISSPVEGIAMIPVRGRRDGRGRWCDRRPRCGAFRIGPDHRRHVRGLARSELDKVGAAIGVDDEIGLDVLAGRLPQDMDARDIPGTAGGFAVDPAGRVTGRDRTCDRTFPARFERDVVDLAGRRLDLLDRPLA